ncbi:anhydro-N-acetylmuramic acid kinase [Streptomyces spiramenti]|nr:anhydro-N-acetylmuramic acid kinase [Streptomyces spiramenti]
MISGTSHDGIDTAVVRFTPYGTTLHADVLHHGETPYPGALRAELRAALPPRAVTAAEVCALDTGIGRAFAAAARVALATAPADLVASHGQTLHHWVADGRALGSLQLGQPAWIAEAAGLPVVSDLRAADLAAGGQGAPLVPALDRLLLAPEVERGRRAGALNLGGIANLTVLARDAEPAAWDLGPANALLDAVVTEHPGTTATYDRGGELASAGTVDEQLLAELLTEPYYALEPPKSCGKELFHAGHVAAARERVRRRNGVATPLPTGAEGVSGLRDLAATLTALTAEVVAREVRAARLDVLILSGGGARNPAMAAAIRRRLPGIRPAPSEEFGVPSDAKEAVAFALIGWLTAHGLPGNVPSCTGASGERVLGRVGAAPGAPLPAVRRPVRRPERLLVGTG